LKPVFLDIDTQNDFMLPAGSLYVAGAERIIPAIAALNRFASEHAIPLISTACCHTEDDPEFQNWPPHCIRGTVGQQKPASTLVPGQIILEKQQLDVFESPKLQPLLAQFDASEYVAYGVVTEVCVKLAAEGLLKFEKPVTLAIDAVQTLDRASGQAFLEDFRRAGGLLATTPEIMRRILRDPS